MSNILLGSLLLILFTSNTNAQTPYFNKSVIVKGNLPFSESVKVDKTLYLSGQVGLIPETQELISGGIKKETEQTLENIKHVLITHNYQMENITKCTIFLKDMDDFPSFNEIYKQYFKEGKYPARSTIGVNDLALNAKVEIECIANK